MKNEKKGKIEKIGREKKKGKGVKHSNPGTLLPRVQIRLQQNPF